MGQVALPELRRYRYSAALATGTIAAGGTLGILIPPSVVLIVYAIIVEANIVTMFAAALIPGLLATVMFIATVAIYVRLVPAPGRRARRCRGSELARGDARDGAGAGDLRASSSAASTPASTARRPRLRSASSWSSLYGFARRRLTLAGMREACSRRRAPAA